MRQLFFAISLAVMVVQTAQAGHLGLGGFGDLGLGDHRGGMGRRGFGGGHGGGGFGVGGSLDAESIQTCFETKFEDLMTDYDTGLAEIEDFYISDEYAEVVDGVETLSDRYDWFLSGIERTIERFGDFISSATDDLAFYEELLAEYEARDDLSEERLERITTRITDIQDMLTIKIDYLTEKQTTLSDNFGSYETFSTDLATYLAEITAAGGGITETDDTTEVTTALALSSIAPLAALAENDSLTEEPMMCDVPETVLEAAAAPEPSSWLACVFAVSLMAARRPRRRRRAA